MHNLPKYFASFLIPTRGVSNLSHYLLGAACLAIFVITQPFASAQSKLDQQFWSHWSDGQAEMQSYDFKQMRYGELREGTAVAIFVTEPFDVVQRVKVDRETDSSTIVLKLNLVQDFSTGVYDYNLMLSAFVNLKGRDQFATGELLKASFSSQEWCGHVFSQLLPHSEYAELMTLSYFEGEEQRSTRITTSAQTLSEDALFHWARGLSVPTVTPGKTLPIQLLRSLKESRLQHRPTEEISAVLEVAAETEMLKVDAGAFQVRRKSIQREDGLRWDFYVESAFPHRIISWKKSDGEVASLIKSVRMSYWQLNRNTDTSALQRLGLNQREARTH